MGLFIKQETRSFDSTTNISDLPGISFGRTYSSVQAIENADVFTAVQMIASDIASLPLQRLQHSMLEHHDELATLFNIKPNQYYNAYQLKFIMVANALLNGESFVEVVRDKTGTPIGLFHIRNSVISYKQDETTQFKLMYELQEGKGKRLIDAEDVLHFKFFSLDGIKGISPLSALREDIDTQKNSKRFLSDFFKNGTHAGGLLKYKGGKLSKEARNKLKKDWQEANAGGDEAHKVLVLDETMEFEAIEIDTEILKLVNTSNHSTEQVAKAFKIPRHKFGLETSNMKLESMNMDYLVSTLQPYLESITNEIMFKLVPDEAHGIVTYRFNSDNYKTIDSETKTNNLRKQLELGIINIDEARREFGREAIEGGMGEKHLVSLNYTTLDQLEKYQADKMNSFPNPLGGDEDE